MQGGNEPQGAMTHMLERAGGRWPWYVLIAWLIPWSSWNPLHAQCTVENLAGSSSSVGNGYRWAQGFIATCTGQLDSLEFFAAEQGPVAADTLRLYSGNAIDGPVLYSQPFPAFSVMAGDPIRIRSEDAFFLTEGEQYTFQFRVSGVNTVFSSSDPYPGGTAFQGITQVAGSDFNFAVHVNATSTAIHDRSLDGVSLYPNPTLGGISLDLGSVQEQVTIKLINGLGQVIWKRQHRSSEVIRMELAAPPGIYFLEWEGDEGRTGRSRVVIGQ